MNVLGPIDREADNRSLEFIERLMKEADGDPYAELAMLDIGMQASRRHQDRLTARRLEIARRMRDDGVPMTEIADAANVNDSYLSRQLIAAGAPRKVDRTRPRRRRGGTPPVQGRSA